MMFLDLDSIPLGKGLFEHSAWHMGTEPCGTEWLAIGYGFNQ